MRYNPVYFATLLLFSTLTTTAFAQELDLAETPLFVTSDNQAMVQLIVQRDNNLFYEAYPTYEDLNGDGVLDNRYKPDEISYIGNFGSNLCYSENLGSGYMYATADATDKKCSGSQWSGDFLNYLTMTRMDVIRRVLYGGKRVVDTETETRLRRAYVPVDNHTWGMEYTSLAVDGYNIADYSPYSAPSAPDTYLHFVTNNYTLPEGVWFDIEKPVLRIRTNQTSRVWQWSDTEAPQGVGNADKELPLEVKVCEAPYLEDFCREYGEGQYKPIGLLHEYGGDDAMKFSLMTGSYENNVRGGVLRKVMSEFAATEVNEQTGEFIDENGIVATLDAIQMHADIRTDIEGDVRVTEHNDCRFRWDNPMSNGNCKAWGNPVAEMMYEGLRYLSGTEEPTDIFIDNVANSDSMDTDLGLSTATWDDPFSTSNTFAQCTNAFQLIISDPSPSYDSDDLPGSQFSTFTGTGLDSLNVTTIADFISSHDDAINTTNGSLKFIGESGSDDDKSPSAKTVTSLSNIRGIAPDAPHREGGYYASSIAYHGYTNDIHPGAANDQKVGNFVLAVGSTLPTIDVKVADGVISFVPYGKTVGLRWSAFLDYTPTNAIVGFNVDYQTDTSGSFRVSFEDNEQGGDNDLDAMVQYSYEVSGNTVTMTVENVAASGGAIQHLGFAVSGSTADGIYLLVRDTSHRNNQYFDFPMDVPPGASPGVGWDDGEPLPYVQTRTFELSETKSAEQMQSPLWYAAKWGGFTDLDGNGVPTDDEWDADRDGNPDNYFPIVNPALAEDALREVFNKINELTATGSAVGLSSSTLNRSTRVYQAEFVSLNWTGDVTSRFVSNDGVLSSSIDWSANDALQDVIDDDARQIITFNANEETGVPFRWPSDAASPTSDELSEDQIEMLSLDPLSKIADGLGEQRINYLRGTAVDDFRERVAPLGDIVHSSPQLVGPPSYFYPDNWGTDEPENDNPYSAFLRTHSDRQRVLYVGANDGMLHAFDAGTQVDDNYTQGTGRELFAYVPNEVMHKLSALTHPSYAHNYFVDGTPRIIDAYDSAKNQWRTVLVGGLRGGGQGFFALDVTDPANIDESAADTTVLWEFTDADDADMGYSYSTPLIARMHNGKWAAIVANGYASTESDANIGTGMSAVYVLDLFTGEIMAKLTSKDVSSTFNGMSQPTAVDLDGDFKVDTIYAGDLAGDIHAFDVSDSSASQWQDSASTTNPLFTASDDEGDAQPITSGISVGTHPTSKGVMLYFGTGKYLEYTDRAASSRQHRLYGLWHEEIGVNPFDNNDATGSLLEQSITSVESLSRDINSDGVDDSIVEVRMSTRNAVDWSSDQGWFIDLGYGSATGEQVVSNPVLRDGKIFVNTHVPTGNICVPNEAGWLMVFNAATGAMTEEAVFDIDANGKFDEGAISGINEMGNPFAEPTFISSTESDQLFTQEGTVPQATSMKIDTSIKSGSFSWKELEP